MAAIGFHPVWSKGSAAERAGLTTASLRVPFFFYETDTELLYYWDGTSWEQFGGPGDGWPFGTTVLTVDTTDPNADYETIALAIAAMGAGDVILASPESHTCDNQSLGLSENMRGVDRDATILATTTQLVALTVNDSSVSNLTVTNIQSNAGDLEAMRLAGAGDLRDVVARANNSGAGDAYAINVTSTSTCRLVDCDAKANVGAGSGVALRTDGNGCTVIIEGGRYDGETYDIGVSANDAVRLMGPTLVNGTIGGAGTITGWYYDADGDLHTVGGADLLFAGATGESAIVVPDNLADALHIIDDGDANDYLTVVSTDAQREVAINQDGADIDFRVEASGVDPALLVRGSDGHKIIEEALHSQGSNFPDLGTTTLAEMIGDVYLGTAKDIYPDNDISGVWARRVNFGQAPGEHWHRNADDLVWTGWAGYVGYANPPNTISHSRSKKYVSHSLLAPGRAFYYRSLPATSIVRLRTRVSISYSCGAGLMIDDGADTGDGLGADNYYRVYLSGIPGTTVNWTLTREYRLAGGAPVAAVSALSLPQADFYGLSLVAAQNPNWGNWYAVMSAFGEAALDHTLQLDNPPFAWTPTRVGLFYYNPAASVRYGVWDWYQEAA